MIRKSIVVSAFLCFLVAITLVPTTYPAYAQEPPGKPPEEAEVVSEADRERLAEEARRAREEERRREAIDEESRAWRDEYVRMATPEEIEARLRSEVNRFNTDIVEFLRAARDVSYYRFAPLSERWALENLGEELDRMEGGRPSLAVHDRWRLRGLGTDSRTGPIHDRSGAGDPESARIRYWAETHQPDRRRRSGHRSVQSGDRGTIPDQGAHRGASAIAKSIRLNLTMPTDRSFKVETSAALVSHLSRGVSHADRQETNPYYS